MKEIRQFLVNQKEIAAMKLQVCAQKEPMNLVDVNYWCERIIHLDNMIKDFNNVHGNGKQKKK